MNPDKGSYRVSFAAAGSSIIHNNFPSEGWTLWQGNGGVFVTSRT